MMPQHLMVAYIEWMLDGAVVGFEFVESPHSVYAITIPPLSRMLNGGTVVLSQEDKDAYDRLKGYKI